MVVPHSLVLPFAECPRNTLGGIQRALRSGSIAEASQGLLAKALALHAAQAVASLLTPSIDTKALHSYHSVLLIPRSSDLQ